MWNGFATQRPAATPDKIVIVGPRQNVHLQQSRGGATLSGVDVDVAETEVELRDVIALELRLLDPVVRASREDVAALLAEDFYEFGRSGTVWDRASIIDLMASADSSDEPVTVEDVHARWVAPGVALVTYRTRNRSRGTLRSSLWRAGEHGWKVVFHQGTDTGVVTQRCPPPIEAGTLGAAGGPEFGWDPQTYMALMAEEVPDYPALQDQLVAAAGEAPATKVLDLGIGNGVTARQVAQAHPGARLVGIDSNADMLTAADAALDPTRTELHQRRLEDPLPTGPFDLVVSMLAVHHLDSPGKADLFARVAAALAPGGRFVLADLVVPDDPVDVVTPIDGVMDTPSPLDEQLHWLQQAGLRTRVAWQHRDLAVVVAEAPETVDG